MPVAAPARRCRRRGSAPAPSAPPGPGGRRHHRRGQRHRPRPATARSPSSTKSGPGRLRCPIDVGPYAPGRRVAETGRRSRLLRPAPSSRSDGGGVAVEQVVTGTPPGSAPRRAPRPGPTTGTSPTGRPRRTPTSTCRCSIPTPKTPSSTCRSSPSRAPRQPADFQGIVVPARGLVGVDVGTHLRRRARVATTVSARAGRIVAWKTQVVTAAAVGRRAVAGRPAGRRPGAAPPRVPGLSLVLGAPDPATLVVARRAGRRRRDRALPDLQPGPDRGRRLARPGARPGIGRALQAEDRAPRHGHGHRQQRIADPQGRGPRRHAPAPTAWGWWPSAPSTPRPHRRAPGCWTCSAPGWPPVVGASRPGPPTPASTTGWWCTTPTRRHHHFHRRPRRRPPSRHQRLVRLSLPAGRRLAVRINDHAADLNGALLVEAGSDVVVERDLYPDQVGGPGRGDGHPPRGLTAYAGQSAIMEVTCPAL